MTTDAGHTPYSLVLRLAGPLQSWGEHSRYNQRHTAAQPTKSGVVGLLAAADGRERGSHLDDLTALHLGVRTDEPGTLLRDYHTVGDHTGEPLPSATLTARGVQKHAILGGRKKFTHVTERFYLQDAVFVVALSGPPQLLDRLRNALRHPAFPLALGRRSCPPTLPLILSPPTGTLWPGPLATVLAVVPCQRIQARNPAVDRPALPSRALPITLDDPHGTDIRYDSPVTFAPKSRQFTARRVRHGWVTVPIPNDSAATAPPPDWFTLLD
ncbi:type I-E CRISPR-associated protein Cas5/CasD [Nocardia sp. NPDC049220]|uniref:type I-E CRISPR-associated protein Cas5/CasD n=1 Tax=Nocardia sp. NPDC049220 TaxID=3155273 RepID=UPI0033C23BD1